MSGAAIDRSARRAPTLSPNARVSLALAGLAVAFYVAVVLNHLLQ